MGCHKPDLSGQVWFDEPFVGRAITANLTEVSRAYTNAQLERAIRHGIAADGRNLIGMPSDMFYHLSDRDLAAIIAFLRSAPPASDTLPATRIGPLGYFGLASGKFKPVAALIDHQAPRLPDWQRADGPVVGGRYLATTICTECHGMDLNGFPGDTPSLTVVAGYSLEAFTILMRTGVPLDERELGLMKTVALSRFSYFTDTEIAAVYAYLRTLATGRPA